MMQGCNIPDISTVVQWKLPSSVSSFVQRAGRAARGYGRTGLAVLLAEKSTYEADLSKVNTELSGAQNKRNRTIRGVQAAPKYEKASKQYAIDHGVLRGGFDGEHDAVTDCADVPLDREAADEGLHTFVQAVTCRRQVLKKVYANNEPCKL